MNPLFDPTDPVRGHSMIQARVVGVSDEGVVKLRFPDGASSLITIPLEKVPRYRRLSRFDAYLAGRTAQARADAAAPDADRGRAG